MPPFSAAAPDVRSVLTESIALLAAAGVETPKLDAEVILCNALGCERVQLISRPDRALSEAEAEAFRADIARRAEGVPVHYLIGRREFYGLEFEVNPDVLIPRPETEALVEETLSRLRPGMRVLDVGCGSGAIAVALAKHAPEARVTASDLSHAALRTARRNAERHGVAAEFFEADLTAAIGSGAVDVVVSNPPYVAERDRTSLPRELGYEPAGALFAGEDGLAVYRRLIPDARRAVRPGGLLALELGQGQLGSIRALAAAAGWREVAVREDLAGVARVWIGEVAGRSAQEEGRWQ